MTQEDIPEESPNSRSNVALIMTVFSGVGSFGSLLLNLTSSSGPDGLTLIWFQAFACLTIVFAVVFIGMDWDLKRNKWPGIEQRYLQLDFLSSAVGPEYAPEALLRMHIESLKKRKRLALSEGKSELAEQYQSEINEAKGHLKSMDK